MLDVGTAVELVEDRWSHCNHLLESLEEADLSRPTRLAGWDVAALLSHITWGVAMEADAVTKMRAGDATPASGEAVPASSGRDLLVDAIRQRTGHLIEVLGQVTDADLGLAAPMPYGPTPFPFALAVFGMEAAVHTDDLADALGIEERLPSPAIDATVTVMAASLPLLAQASSESADEGDGYHLSGSEWELSVARRDGQWVVGESGDRSTIIDSDPSSLTLFLMGRIPPTDNRLHVRGDGPGIERFKRFFPGP